MRSSERPKVRQIRETITFRLAFVFGLLFSAGLIAFGGLIYAMTARELTARSDQILQQEAQQLLAVPADQLPAEIRSAVVRNKRGLNYFALLSPSGERVAGNLGPIPSVAVGKSIDIEAAPGHGPLRVTAVEANTGETILLGRDIKEIRYLLRRMVVIMMAGSVTIIPAVLGLGAVLSLAPLRRVQDLQAASRQIAAGQFDVRIATTGRNDEIDQIAATINAMVGDIERVLSQVKNVTDSIAHDLRTPLTHIRNRLDEARAIGTPLRSEAIDDLIGDLDIVLDRFAALLRIAELEASERRSGFGRLDASALLRTVTDLYAPFAEDAGISLELRADGACEIDGDADLLLEAIGNLLDNAIKFATSRVSIAAHLYGDVVEIVISDDGPGIAEAERAAVIQRFYRSSQAATKPGFGLGLSIVTAILHIHRYSIELDDACPGLMVRITAQAQSLISVDAI